VLDDLGHLMIHGSAIDTPGGAVIFIGDTGLGKSTLAAASRAGVESAVR
jgi:putative ribosome biogenesis GTPase RsgA